MYEFFLIDTRDNLVRKGGIKMVFKHVKHTCKEISFIGPPLNSINVTVDDDYEEMKYSSSFLPCSYTEPQFPFETYRIFLF